MLVMSVVGVIAGQAGQADDGIAVDSHQACGGADTTSFLEVSEDRHDLVVGEFAGEEDGPFVLRERLLAGVAAEEAVLAVLSEAIVNRKVPALRCPNAEHRVLGQQKRVKSSIETRHPGWVGEKCQHTLRCEEDPCYVNPISLGHYLNMALAIFTRFTITI